MIISVPVHTAECSTRPVGAFTVLVGVQRSSRQVGGTGVGMGVGVGVGLKGVGVGVGVELGVGVGVGPGTGTSNAPISTVPLKTRLKPGPRLFASAARPAPTFVRLWAAGPVKLAPEVLPIKL